MKIEAERLKESDVDIETALQRKLRVSETVKVGINEKVIIGIWRQLLKNDMIVLI